MIETLYGEIAVLLPVYNPGQELAFTLASLKAQTARFKLFIVDDGSASKPDYPVLLQDLSHELIVLPRNRGIVGALNAGLAAILSEGYGYVARIDNGDYAYPERLDIQRRYMDMHPDISIVGSWTEMVREDLSLAYNFTPPCEDAEIRTSIAYNLPLNHPSMMIRADLFREIGPYSNEFDAAEDYELARRACSAKKKLANIDRYLFRQVMHANSISARKRRTQLFSRLRIQWRYRQLTNIHCWLGMAKTLTLFVLPRSVVQRLKRTLLDRTPRAEASPRPKAPLPAE